MVSGSGPGVREQIGADTGQGDGRDHKQQRPGIFGDRADQPAGQTTDQSRGPDRSGQRLEHFADSDREAGAADRPRVITGMLPFQSCCQASVLRRRMSSTKPSPPRSERWCSGPGQPVVRSRTGQQDQADHRACDQDREALAGESSRAASSSPRPRSPRPRLSPHRPRPPGVPTRAPPRARVR